MSAMAFPSQVLARFLLSSHLYELIMPEGCCPGRGCLCPAGG